MAFTSICSSSAIGEGGMGQFRAGKKSVVLLWPVGGQLAAFRGRCPHADVPFEGAVFDGRTLTCTLHNWGFDGANGKCTTHLVPNKLHPYPVRVEGDEIQVDLGPVRSERPSV